MLAQRLKQALAEAASSAVPNITLPEFNVTHPELEEHGDFATNIALILARSLKINPLLLAERIVLELPQLDWLEKAEAVRPGFINFRLKNQFFLQELERVTQLGDEYGKSTTGAGRRILFEYGQPNTHKLPHVGHLFSYCYGESCTRLLEFTGHRVNRVNYQGDVGLHVAKCLWAYQKKIKDQGLKIKDIEKMSLAEKIKYLQECYQHGAAAYEEDEQAKLEIEELNVAIYRSDPSIKTIWQETRDWSLASYRRLEQSLGIHYDRYYLESAVGPIGTEIVREKVGSIFEESDGAVIFRGEPYGLHTRVFINRFGNPTYEAKDIGLAQKKKEDFEFDLSVYTTASEQNEYWQVLAKVIELIWPWYKGKLKHIGFGLVSLTTGKMSSRTGDIVSAFELVEMTEAKIGQIVKANRNYSKQEIRQISEIVGLGAVKYSLLKSTATKNITFDLESSIDFAGNSGPYLQYTYARCQSILTKARLSSSTGPPAGGQDPRLPQAGRIQIPDQVGNDLNEEELSLLRWLYRFPEVVESAASDYAPHLLCNYLFELAQRYSLFYDRHTVLTDDRQLANFRLGLTAATGQILKTGLYLLGIEVADKI